MPTASPGGCVLNRSLEFVLSIAIGATAGKVARALHARQLRIYGVCLKSRDWDSTPKRAASITANLITDVSYHTLKTVVRAAGAEQAHSLLQSGHDTSRPEARTNETDSSPSDQSIHSERLHGRSVPEPAPERTTPLLPPDSRTCPAYADSLSGAAKV